MYFISSIFILLLAVQRNRADISHLLTPDYAIFPQHPFYFGFHQQLQPPQQQQASLPALYGPPQATQPEASYPNPVTPAPVAPTQIATTEFFLPEIVENRSAKEQRNFIPLQNQYLPPDLDERPNYESPKPPNQGDHHHNHQDHHHGYYYPRPTASTTTTTESPSPIVVVEPADPLPPFNGYDYNAPPSAPLRPSTPAPVYLPPPAVVGASGFGSEESGLVSHLDTSNPLRVRIKEMRCMQPSPGAGGTGFFRAALKVESFLAATPSVDNDSNDKRCELRLARGNVYVDIAAEDFAKCGVRLCGKDLCLRLRFPAIRGMRTGNDAILTLHCKSQDRIAVKTHALKVGVANDVQSRSIGTYAQGGSQNAFRTHIELLRRARHGGFTRHLESNGAVQLGEDLLLRAHVLPGDGWNYTRLTDVSLQRISPSGELLNKANLVTSLGCINPSMSSICNQAPIYDPPLGHKLNFKAVMFQGMHSGDELVMSMRITGCIEPQDCQVSQQECASNEFGSLGRRRRDTATSLEADKQASAAEISEISRISFRVIMDNFEMDRIDKRTGRDINESLITLQPRVFVLAASVGFVLVLICLGVIATWKLNK